MSTRSTTQELIDLLNSQISNLNSLIGIKTQEKNSLDQQIEQQNLNITYFQNQKDQCDTDIASYNDDIEKTNEIITNYLTVP